MPKVFISYSQEPDAHKARVLALAQALLRDGVEVELDQFHAHRILDWPRWCLQQLRKADFVLCVCTREYRDRVYGDVPADTGKGVHWEGAVLDDEFYDTKGNRRILPLLLMPESGDSIPDFMRGWTYCRVTEPEMSDAGYELLYRILTGQPLVTPAPVGALRNLPPANATGTTAPASVTAGMDVTAVLSAAIATAPAGNGAVSVQQCTVHVGVSVAELLPLIEAEKHKAAAPLHAQLDDLARRLGLTEEAIRNFLRILGEREIPADRLAERFAEIVQRHRDTLQRLTVLAADDPAVNGLIEQARTAVQAGDYDEADRLLAESEHADLIVARQAQSLALAAQAAARQHFLAAAAARAERGDLAMTRIDYLAAAEHFRQAAASVPADDSEARADYLHRQASALYQQGDEFGDNAALLKAITVLCKKLELRSRECMPLDWAGTQNSLGNALRTLGERESGTARLEEAVVAYRAALGEYTRECVPLDWATTQNNLGIALQKIGARESSTSRLKEAIAAFRAALGERTRERVPLAWAATQNGLGNALNTLGERESDTSMLEEAVVAYRAALDEYTRERVPLNWAMTQNNLGTALWRLSERESGTARLLAAVAAYRAALNEQTRERVPLDWAMTQNNLGLALLGLGEREAGKARLEEAVAAFRAALGEYIRERVPLAWAMVQNNLGNALLTLGERESGTARLQEAVAAYLAALEERTRERVPLDWAATQYNLGLALQALGERESNTARLQEAVAAYRAALEVFREAQAAYYVQVAENNLQKAETLLAARRR